MQSAQAEHSSPLKAEILSFPETMGKTTKNEKPAGPSPATLWQKHGTSAQWAAMVIALVSSIGLPIYFRHVDADSKITKDALTTEINTVVTPQISTLLTQMNEKI